MCSEKNYSEKLGKFPGTHPRQCTILYKKLHSIMKVLWHDFGDTPIFYLDKSKMFANKNNGKTSMAIMPEPFLLFLNEFARTMPAAKLKPIPGPWSMFPSFL